MIAVTVPIGGDLALEGDLDLPARPRGLVLFAHGSGSSRHSPRNRKVAAMLHDAGLATLLIDLLTAEEGELDARTATLRFDVTLLAERLVGVTDWVMKDARTRGLGIAYFGASTGAAAALIAAAQRPDDVRAIVSRGGRPDLAGPALSGVQAPTLLIVGENDVAVLALNRKAAGRLRTEVELVIVPHATHLFEEPGALEQVSHLAARWFQSKLELAPAPGHWIGPLPTL